MVNWAEQIGPNTALLFERILAEKPHPEMGYRRLILALTSVRRCLRRIQLSRSSFQLLGRVSGRVTGGWRRLRVEPNFVFIVSLESLEALPEIFRQGWLLGRARGILPAAACYVNPAHSFHKELGAFGLT
jgi:hypothetical protein